LLPISQITAENLKFSPRLTGGGFGFAGQ